MGKKRIAALSLIILAALTLSSCRITIGDTVYTDGSGNGLTVQDGGAGLSDFAQSPAPAQEEPDGIPFKRTPEMPQVSRPPEETGDELEREAAEIIDGAIAHALTYLSVMRDDRHAKADFPFDPDSNGYISKLKPQERNLYDGIIAAAKSGEDFKINEKDYDGELNDAFFALYEPLCYGEPYVATFCDIDTTHYIRFSDMSTHATDLFTYYFDPYRDQNSSVRTGEADKKDVLHAAALLDRVIKRVARKMPGDLSTYDKYYYLAAVLCERCEYDKRPKNAFNAFGALIGGKAVCEGYTAAYWLLCREAGLWCAYRNGMPDGQGHTWNMVKLDSGIYNADVTWCDAEAPYERDWYDCFIKSDEAFYADGHEATSGVAGTGVFEPSPYEEKP
ncbi:MAG: hypothetical protein IJS65_03225 [Clostridia bacterium]|nr:hypothetical protein [Clostridia bacterium]